MAKQQDVHGREELFSVLDADGEKFENLSTTKYIAMEKELSSSVLGHR